MYAPPPRRAEFDSMKVQFSTSPISPLQRIVPPSPPKYWSIAQSTGEIMDSETVILISSNCFHLFSSVTTQDSK